MAYAEVLFFENTDLHGDDWRVSLDRFNFVSSATETTAVDSIFELNYQQIDNLFNPFIASELTASFVIPQVYSNLLNDISNQPDGTYQISLRKNGDIVWQGVVDKGLITYTEDVYPLAVNIRATCGIGEWSRTAYVQEGPIDLGENQNQRPLALVDSLTKIASSFSHNICWKEKNITSGDLVRQLRVNDHAWQTGDEFTDDFKPISKKFVAEQYARRFLARWYQWQGWNLEQPEGVVNRAAFKTSVQGGSDSTSSSAPQIVEATAKDFDRNLRVELRPSLRSSDLTFRHNASFDIILFPDTYTDAGYFRVIDYTFNESNEGNRILWNGSVDGLNLNVEPEDRYFLDVILKTSKPDGTVARWWNNSTKKWQETEYKNTIPCPTGTTATSYVFQTEKIVTGTENIRVELSPIYRRIAGVFETTVENLATNFLTSEFVIDGLLLQNTNSTSTQAVTDNGSNDSYSHGTLSIGDDKPTSPYVIKREATGEFTQGFTSPGQTSPEIIDRLTTRTINRFYTSARKVLIGILFKEYEPYQMLSYEGVNYIFGGGSLGSEGYWQGVWHEATYSNEAVAFNEIQGDASNFNSSIFAGNNFESTNLLEVKEVLGSVTVTDIQTDLLVEWENIQVILKDGTRFAVEDGVFEYQPETPQEMLNPPVRVFYYDKPNNAIVQKTYDDWISSDEFFDSINYAELFRLTRNKLTSPDDAAPKTDVDVAPIAKALFSDENADNAAVIREIIAGFRVNSVTKLGLDVNDSVDELICDDSMPLRVDLPLGTRLLIVSGDETYEVVTRQRVNSGSLNIPIFEANVFAYKGAKVLFDNAFIQSQLLIQPSEVYVFAQSVDGKATSAFNLATNNEEARFRLESNLGVDGVNIVGRVNNTEGAILDLEAKVGDNSAGLIFEVNEIQSTGVLRVKADGTIASVSLDADPETGSDIDINADQINVTGLFNVINNGSNTTINGDRLTTNTIELQKLLVKSDNSRLHNGDLERFSAGWYYASDAEFVNPSLITFPANRLVTANTSITFEESADVVEDSHRVKKVSNTPSTVQYLYNNTPIVPKKDLFDSAQRIKQGTRLSYSAFVKSNSFSSARLGYKLIRQDGSTIQNFESHEMTDTSSWESVQFSLEYSNNSAVTLGSIADTYFENDKINEIRLAGILLPTQDIKKGQKIVLHKSSNTNIYQVFTVAEFVQVRDASGNILPNTEYFVKVNHTELVDTFNANDLVRNCLVEAKAINASNEVVAKSALFLNNFDAPAKIVPYVKMSGTGAYVNGLKLFSQASSVEIADGTVTAEKMVVDELSAITAKMGNLEVTGDLVMNGGKFATNITGARIQMQNDSFNLYDDNDEIVFGLDKNTKEVNIFGTTSYSTENGIEINITDATVASESQSITWFSKSQGVSFAAFFTDELYGVQTITQLNSQVFGSGFDGDAILIVTSVDTYNTTLRSNHAWNGISPTPIELVQFDSVTVDFGNSPAYSIRVDTGTPTRTNVAMINCTDTGQIRYEANSHTLRGLVYMPDIPDFFIFGSKMIYRDSNNFLKIAT